MSSKNHPNSAQSTPAKTPSANAQNLNRTQMNEHIRRVVTNAAKATESQSQSQSNTHKSNTAAMNNTSVIAAGASPNNATPKKKQQSSNVAIDESIAGAIVSNAQSMDAIAVNSDIQSNRTASMTGGASIATQQQTSSQPSPARHSNHISHSTPVMPPTAANATDNIDSNQQSSSSSLPQQSQPQSTTQSMTQSTPSQQSPVSNPNATANANPNPNANPNANTNANANANNNNNSNSTNLHIILRQKQFQQIEPICNSLQRHPLKLVDNLVTSYYLNYEKLLEQIFNVLAQPNSDMQHKLTAALLLVLPFVNSALTNDVARRYVEFDRHDVFCPGLVDALSMDHKRVSVDMKGWILCTLCNVIEQQHDLNMITRVKDHYTLVAPCLQILQCHYASYRMQRYAIRILYCELYCGISARQNLRDLHTMLIVMDRIPLLQSQMEPPPSTNDENATEFNEKQWLIIQLLRFLYGAFQYEEMWEWDEYVPMPPEIDAVLTKALEAQQKKSQQSVNPTANTNPRDTKSKKSDESNDTITNPTHPSTAPSQPQSQSQSQSQSAQSQSQSQTGQPTIPSLIRVPMTPSEFIQQLKIKCESLAKFTCILQVKVAAQMVLDYPLSSSYQYQTVHSVGAYDNSHPSVLNANANANVNANVNASTHSHMSSHPPKLTGSTIFPNGSILGRRGSGTHGSATTSTHHRSSFAVKSFPNWDELFNKFVEEQSKKLPGVAASNSNAAATAAAAAAAAATPANVGNAMGGASDTPTAAHTTVASSNSSGAKNRGQQSQQSSTQRQSSSNNKQSHRQSMNANSKPNMPSNARQTSGGSNNSNENKSQSKKKKKSGKGKPFRSGGKSYRSRRG